LIGAAQTWLAARDVQAELSPGWECAARRGGTGVATRCGEPDSVDQIL